MRPRTRKPLDVEAVLHNWRGAAPTPGFASRVLAAVDAPARPPARSSRRSLLLVAVVAAAVLLLPFIVQRGSRGADASPPVAFVDADLGIQRD